MVSVTKEEVIKLVRDDIDRSGLVIHCMNCRHGLSTSGNGTVSANNLLCNLNPQSGQPPPNILVYGCPNWELKEFQLQRDPSWAAKLQEYNNDNKTDDDWDDDIPF